MASAGGGNIKVVVRVRPFNTRELDRSAKCIVSMKDGQTILTPPSSDHKPKNNKAATEGVRTFAYDKSYWSFNKDDPNFAGQDSVFEDLGKPLLDNAFQGYNNCIFAYGQTGSGKSYSMMGFGAEAGVIPRICRDMFERIDKMQEDKNLTCTVEVSYLEIYNERVRDLLNPANKGNLKVREHPSTGPYVEDLAKLAVRSFPEIENLMDEGNKARTVAATNMNETSSRSHAVFTLSLTQKRHDVETKMDMERSAKISLVDLAGSERANSTGATGARLKEGAEINRSLSTLGRVIAALADASTGKKKASMVPYRDSVLTWLLKDSLGGNSLTAMIAAISPADINYEETLSTLRYADSAKRIKNHAVVNEDANARMIRELKEELAQLRAKLSGGAAGAGVGGIQYSPDTPLDQQMVLLTQPDGTTRQVSKAEIAEQLSQAEKLYQDVNQTWEQKLAKTEAIHREREAALEELGISIEKGFVGLSTPKKMPHLVNLSDDPLLAECLVYNLKPGRTTVGNDEPNGTAEIRLAGSKILAEHCVFENLEGVVSVIPSPNAAVMVNGLRINKTKRLKSGFRVILGDFHIFRFNNPQEARAERAEQGSLLKHSLTVDEVGSPAPRRDLSRSRSRDGSDIDTERRDSESPRVSSPNENDYDWTFARREAASAILGSDQKISSLTDEELDLLFDDVQRARAGRKGRLFEHDDDSDSTASYPIREKYLSAATLDNFSLDTALTAPSTPPQSEEPEKLKNFRDEMQTQLDKQKDDYQETLRAMEASNVQVEEMKADKIRMEQNLNSLKEEMERQLQQQKEEYETRLKEMDIPRRRSKTVELSPQQKALARQALNKWRQKKYVGMAASILQYASLLKEAQILSQELGKTLVFQFAVVDSNQTLVSSYDMVLNGISDDNEDELESESKPCIGIRVTDFKNKVIYLWSLKKLQKRVRLMRQMQQYLGRPEYLQHFRLDNPFSESCLPQFSRIGEAQVSLAAVFESRVQDFTADVISPYSFNVMAILKLSLEPSTAEAPPSTLKFNVVLHEMIGFTEMEGTEVHAQLYVPRISEDGGATTSQMISGFDEGPVRFESLHGMSLPLSSSRDSYLRVAIFSKVTAMHLDKLLSWDDMRDSARRRSHSFGSTRLPEHEYRLEERHDVFARVQILELSEQGQYEPVEVIQHDTMDSGAYQLHQGLQRRIVVNLTHTSSTKLPWQEIKSVRTGNVRLMDSAGQVPNSASEKDDVPLKLVTSPTMLDNADGTSNVTLTGQWDSSAHESVLLDRTTTDKYRVQLSLQWNVLSSKLANPMTFALDFAVQIRPRSYLRATSILSQLWASARVSHSTSGVFSISIKPNPAKSVIDLWRMDTKHDYVKGEEMLFSWAPRGVSLIRDYIQYRKKQQRAADIEAAKGIFGKQGLSIESDSSNADTDSSNLSPSHKQLLMKVIKTWQSVLSDPTSSLLMSAHAEPPLNGAAFAVQPTSPTSLIPNSPSSSDRATLLAAVHHHPKNPALLKAGYLLVPSATQSSWVRRYLELRRPYLHIYSVPDGDELNAINLRDSRVDHQPQVAQLLRRPGKGNEGVGGLNVFAIYARENAYLFATRSDREKLEWVLRIDESYFGSSSGGATPEEN